MPKKKQKRIREDLINLSVLFDDFFNEVNDFMDDNPDIEIEDIREEIANLERSFQ